MGAAGHLAEREVGCVSLADGDGGAEARGARAASGEAHPSLASENDAEEAEEGDGVGRWSCAAARARRPNMATLLRKGREIPLLGEAGCSVSVPLPSQCCRCRTRRGGPRRTPGRLFVIRWAVPSAPSSVDRKNVMGREEIESEPRNSGTPVGVT
jgi:hypothetical protein